MFGQLKQLAVAANHRAGLSFERTCLYRLGSADRRPAVSPSDPRASWSRLSADRVHSLVDLGEFNAQDGIDRLRRGDCCYIATLDGRLAHYSWVQHSGEHPITQAGKDVPVKPGEFWIYNCRTAAWARGKALYPSALARILGEYFAHGYSAAWIYTARRNRPSQRGITRAGFQFVTTLKALRVGSRYHRLGASLPNLFGAATAPGAA